MGGDFGRVGALRLGYVRWSELRPQAVQMSALAEAGTGVVFVDGPSRKLTHRPGWTELTALARPGDVVVVHSLDRLGRSLAQTVETLADLSERRVAVEWIDGHGRVGPGDRMGTVLAGAARELRLERAGELQHKQGVGNRKIGRPRVLSDEQMERARGMLRSGDTVGQIAREFDVSVKTIRRHVIGVGNQVGSQHIGS